MILVLWDVLFYIRKNSVVPGSKEIFTFIQAVWFRGEGAWLDLTMQWMECTICAHFEQEVDSKISKPIHIPGKLHQPDLSCTRISTTTVSFCLP